MDRGRSSPVPQIGPLAGQYRDAVWSAAALSTCHTCSFPEESREIHSLAGRARRSRP